MKKIILALFYVCVFYSIGWGQQNVRLRKLGLDNGLSQSSIHQIYQDVEGFIWIATEDGLNRYDGYEFTVYRPSLKNKQSICNNWVNEIQEDNENNLWISTYYGLSRWNRDKNNFTNFLPENTKELTGRDFSKLCYSRDKKLWFVNESEIGNYNNQTKKFTVFDLKKHKLPLVEPLKYISILEDKMGNVWVISKDSGLVVFKNNIPTLIKENDNTQLLTNNIRSAIIGVDGEIWLSSYKGLMHYNSKTEKFSTISDDGKSNPKIPDANIRHAIFDNQNNLWILLNENGIVKIDSKTQEQLHYTKSSKSFGISTNSYNDVFKDYTGKLWFYAADGINGLTIYNPQTNKFNSYNAGSNSLSTNKLSTFFAGKNGEVWIGTNGGGLNIYNPQLENFKHVFSDPLSDSTLDQSDVRHILKDKKGRTWIGTTTALNMKKSDGQGFVSFLLNTKNAKGLTTRGIAKLYEDIHGRIWIGTWDGIYLYKETLQSFKKIKINSKNKQNDNQVRFIYENKSGELLLTYNHATLVMLDNNKMEFNEVAHFPFLEGETVNRIINLKNDQIFFGTWNSFFIYDNKTKNVKHYEYKYGDKTSISNTEVNDAMLQNDTILWLATANGLNKFNINTEIFKHYFIEDGLPNQYIYSLLFDSLQNIWMSTNKGISKFNIVTEKFRNYDVNDGLQSNEFNGGAAFSNGKEFFFGGINGYNFFIPSQIKINENPPLLYFTELYVDNKKVTSDTNSKILKKRLEDTESISLQEGIHNLTVHFVALDFSLENGINYFYSLEKEGGKTAVEWYQVNSQRNINISNPEFGEYLLKIKAVNTDGFESEIKQLVITILPPFYKTFWFKLSLVLLFLFTVFVVYRIRIKSIKKQKTELEKLVDERTHEVVEQRDEAEKQKKIAIQQKEEVAIQKEIIEVKNKEIVDSIHYAKRIQDALLQSEGHDSKHLPDHFILFKPKDIVSGDFYWALEKQDYLYVAAVDCTGHGVPGAFMSMLGIAYLNEINAGEDVLGPSQILDRLRNKIVENLSGEKGENKDGMDMSLYKLNLLTNEIEWAGSNNPLWIVAKNLDHYPDITTQKWTTYKNKESNIGGLIEIKPDKQAIGYNETVKPFITHSVKLQKNDLVYIFTDGFADQFGGDKGKKFKYKSLKQLVLEIEELPMEQQKIKLNDVFEKWRGPLEQIDDVCLIGLKV